MRQLRSFWCSSLHRPNSSPSSPISLRSGANTTTKSSLFGALYRFSGDQATEPPRRFNTILLDVGFPRKYYFSILILNTRLGWQLIIAKTRDSDVEGSHFSRLIWIIGKITSAMIETTLNLSRFRNFFYYFRPLLNLFYSFVKRV